MSKYESKQGMDLKFRGKGLGECCLKKALAEAPAFEIHTLLGFIFGHNLPSLKLFAKLGFESWAWLPEIANMDGVMRDLIILGKKSPLIPILHQCKTKN